ncbi:MAG: DUF4418 family protein [Candidatus Adiutrix sp.]|jgi:hypothetical protein|nr:DUF4418 family protein [Candidatus Adiutrix sp.]
MKHLTFFGSAVLGAGLLYFLVPLIFPICQAAHGPAMKCFWTARAEMGVGAAVMSGGLLYSLSADLQRRLGLSLMIGVLAILGGAFPTFLIGVCANEAMLCRAGAQPAWLLTSAFLLISALLNARRLAVVSKPDPLDD